MSRERPLEALNPRATERGADEHRSRSVIRLDEIVQSGCCQEASNMSTRIIVNGESRVVDAAPDTPLLYVLRNDLGLNGPKFGLRARAVRSLRCDSQRQSGQDLFDAAAGR
jgi:hypothetical protein